MSTADGKRLATSKEHEDELATVEKDYTGQVLKQVEENYSNFVKSQITYYEYLMNAAEQKGDEQLYTHHKVLLETYQTMLANVRLSNRYSTV